MPTLCVCSAVLAPEPSYKVTRSPCRCEHPAGWRKVLIREDLPGFVSAKQVEERTRLGLPVVTDIERASTKRWV